MNKEETRAACIAGLPPGLDKYKIRPDWLVGLIIAVRDSGRYAYNADIVHAANVELGTEYPENGSTLSVLVYNAQKFSREDMLRRDGFQPATQELLATLDGHKVTALQNGSLAGPSEVRVRIGTDGRYHLMLPRARKRCLADYADNWVRA